tara:strand:- start:4324 stop:4620 length:297 start_codon:yes stop_codon:yes gene_type:complete
MQRFNTNFDSVDYGGVGCFFLFLIVIIIILSSNPLWWVWWIWLFLLIPVGGWGGGRVYYYKRVPVKTVTTYEPINEPRSPKEGSEPSGVSIEMTELKF